MVCSHLWYQSKVFIALLVRLFNVIYFVFAFYSNQVLHVLLGANFFIDSIWAIINRNFSKYKRKIFDLDLVHVVTTTL